MKIIELSILSFLFFSLNVVNATECLKSDGSIVPNSSLKSKNSCTCATGYAGNITQNPAGSFSGVCSLSRSPSRVSSALWVISIATISLSIGSASLVAGGFVYYKCCRATTGIETDLGSDLGSDSGYSIGIEMDEMHFYFNPMNQVNPYMVQDAQLLEQPMDEISINSASSDGSIEFYNAFSSLSDTPPMESSFNVGVNLDNFSMSNRVQDMIENIEETELNEVSGELQTTEYFGDQAIADPSVATQANTIIDEPEYQDIYKLSGAQKSSSGSDGFKDCK